MVAKGEPGSGTDAPGDWWTTVAEDDAWIRYDPDGEELARIEGSGDWCELYFPDYAELRQEAEQQQRACYEYKGYVMVLMPGGKNIDLKGLARAYSVKRAAMTDTSTAERLTGYLVGGISPFETKQNLPVVMEESLMRFDNVAVNAGKRGLMAIMDPKDLLWLVNGDVLNSIGITD